MLTHYIKIAIRNLFRNKVFSLINILGLAVGMGVCLLIFQYIQFELSYDQFHAKAQNTYRITITEERNGEDLRKDVFTPYGLGVSAKEDIPEVEEFCRIYYQDEDLVFINPARNESFMEEGILYVDSTFLEMFDFPLKNGVKESALKDKYSIVLTEQIAIKYFGNSNPIGEVLKVSGGVYSGNFVVTGVVKALPIQSHLQFNVLMPLHFLLENERLYSEEVRWDYRNFVSYVSINDDANPYKVGEKLDQVLTTYAGEVMARNKVKWESGLQLIPDIHLGPEYAEEPVRNNGNKKDVQFYSIVAIFILLMAWVNYINLSTSQGLQRAKEVGVRKSIGAGKKQLIRQFLVESILINFIAGTFSIGIAKVMVPLLSHIIGKDLPFTVLQHPEFWGWFIGAVILGSFISGMYPAFVLSSFKPVRVFSAAKFGSTRGFSLRKGLIVFQFLVSVLLISGTYLVYSQVTFMKDQDLGIDMERILLVKGPMVILEVLEEEGTTLEGKYEIFKKSLANQHAVTAVSATSSVPGKGYFYTEGFRLSGEEADKNQEGSVLLVDTDFPEAYGLEFLAKAPFEKEIAPDEKVIINEEASKLFGLGSADEALHKILVNNYGESLEVVGVVKNFHWSSLRDAHSPHLFVLNNSYGAYFSIKMGLRNIPENIASIKAAYHAAFPNDPFLYSFLNEDFNRQYQADLQFRNLFTAFSVLAIFIACLGLFALVSFSASLRVKEVGIRKVLGASVGQLMVLLSRQYLLLLLTANVLAVPIIIIGAKYWLNHYAFRIDIGTELFLIPALLLFIISLITVSYRTYATARANPVQSLRKD